MSSPLICAMSGIHKKLALNAYFAHLQENMELPLNLSNSGVQNKCVNI
jgi:hypothetical protein